MKHAVKVTMFFEIDTLHSDFTGPDDIDSVVQLARTELYDLYDLAGSNEGECMSLQSVQVEAVE